MKIGIVSTTGNLYSWAGSEETWRIMATHALEIGHEISLLLPPRIAGSPQVESLQLKGAKLNSYPIFNPLTRRLALKNFYSRYTSFFSQDHDVIFISTGGISDCAWIPDLNRELNKSSIPLVYFIQSNAEGAISEEHVRRNLRSTYKKASRMIFLSKHNLKLAERQLAWKFEKAEIIMNPLRGEVPNALPWLSSATDSLDLAEVARFEVQDKQQDHLLEALSGDKWKNRNWKLTFYGSGPDEEHILNLIRFYGLENKARIGGFVNDFREIWVKHHIHVLPSRREGMPLSLIESMACGRPALVTRAGGSPELVDDGLNGFVCPGMHPEVLQDSLEHVWNSRSKLEDMGKSAAQKIKKVVSDNWAGEILKVIEKAAASS